MEVEGHDNKFLVDKYADDYDFLIDYENFVARGMSDKVPEHMHLAWAQMGLVTEVGEFVEVHEKALRKEGALTDLDTDKMVDELGDVLWYLVANCHVLGVDIAELILHNTKKLNARGYK